MIMPNTSTIIIITTLLCYYLILLPETVQPCQYFVTMAIYALVAARQYQQQKLGCFSVYWQNKLLHLYVASLDHP
jgi:hypothetical protein